VSDFVSKKTVFFTNTANQAHTSVTLCCSIPDSVQQASVGTWSLLELGDTETI